MLFLFVLTIFVDLTVSLDHTRIVGGRNARIEEYPWQITLRRKIFSSGAFIHFCGGSIVNERVIITAAHCVNKRDPRGFVVVAGTPHKSGNDGILTRVERFVVHENYNISVYDNDVALILLESPLPLNLHSIVPVKLAESVPSTGEIATITGWGSLEEGGPTPEILQSVDVPIVAIEECEKSYDPNPVLESMICAGMPTGGKDACQGDSGGPLVIRNVQYGIVSWGMGCARPTQPGVYSSVANLRPWIDKNVQELLKNEIN